jgi:hypothetical protein
MLQLGAGISSSLYAPRPREAFVTLRISMALPGKGVIKTDKVDS